MSKGLVQLLTTRVAAAAAAAAAASHAGAGAGADTDADAGGDGNINRINSLDASGVRPFPLEDVAVALWVNDLITEPIAMVETEEFNRNRYCIDSALNVLIERGAPLYVDPNAAMHMLVDRDQQIDDGRLVWGSVGVIALHVGIWRGRGLV
jgi:hypothetical protein